MLLRTIVGACGLIVASSAASAQDLTAVDDGLRITISDRGRQILSYVYSALDEVAPDSDDVVPAANYFHPVYGLYGEEITGESPSQWSGAPGIQWSWTRLGCDEGTADLIRGEGGKRLFERIDGAGLTESGLTVSIQNVWVVGPNEIAQVIETLTFTVGPLEEDRRYIDVDVVLQSVSTGKVYLGGSIPGSGLTLSLSPERDEWLFSGGSGELRTADTAYMSPWLVCSYRDDRRSTRSGVAILQDSRNPGFSQPNWLVESEHRVTGGVPEMVKAELRPGEFLKFRYRLILHHLGGSRTEMTREYAKFMGEDRHGE